MKPLIVSSVLLVIVVIGLVINALYIENLTEQLIGITADLPAAVSESFDKAKIHDKMTVLYKIFNNNEKIIALSLSYAEIERIKNAIITMNTSFLCDQIGDYLIARERLLCYLHRLECNELISLDNIT